MLAAIKVRHVKTQTQLIVILCWLMKSCTTIECEEFNLEREIMRYNLFPSGEESYRYVSEGSDTIVLNQVAYDRSPFNERRCHMCACGQILDVTYESEDQALEFRNIANYDTELFPEWPGGTNYSFGAPVSFFTIQGDSLFEDFSEPAGDTAEYLIRNNASIRLNDSIYAGMVELTPIDTSETPITTVWIKPGNGMIGFRHNEREWIIINN